MALQSSFSNSSMMRSFCYYLITLINPAAYSGKPVNFKYLRSRKWYRTFRLFIMLAWGLSLIWNYYHAKNFWGRPSFSWQAFLAGSAVMVGLVGAFKYAIVRLVEGQKMYQGH
jgi:hypothetical protein